MYHSVEDADHREGLAYGQIRSIWGIPVPSLLFCSELQAALKNKLLITKTMPLKNNIGQVDSKHAQMPLKFLLCRSLCLLHINEKTGKLRCLTPMTLHKCLCS